MPLFAPYCGGAGPALELALARLQLGQFEGLRALRGGDHHGYVLRWTGALAPLEENHCELRFPARPQIHYSFSVPAYRLLAWLAQSEADDLPDGFWRWLILGDDSGA